MSSPDRFCKQHHMENQFAASKGGSVWVAYTTYPLSECLNDKFFLHCRHQLHAGDFINLIRYVDDGWEEVVERAMFVGVDTVDSNGVSLSPTFPIQRASGGTRTGESGVVVTRGFAGKFPVRIDGAVERDFNTMVEAREYGVFRAKELGLPFIDMTEKPKNKAA